MIRSVRLLLLFMILLVGMFSLMPNGELIQFYLGIWNTLGLHAGRFGDNYLYISRAGHILAYGILTALLISAFRGRPFACTAAVVALAALLEAGQFWTVTRQPHLADFACSALGALLGLGVRRLGEGRAGANGDRHLRSQSQ